MNCTSKQQELVNPSRACTQRSHLLCLRASCRCAASHQRSLCPSECTSCTQRLASQTSTATKSVPECYAECFSTCISQQTSNLIPKMPCTLNESLWVTMSYCRSRAQNNNDLFISYAPGWCWRWPFGSTKEAPMTTPTRCRLN